MKRMLSLILSVLLVLTCCPAAFAAPQAEIVAETQDVRPPLPEGFRFSAFDYEDETGGHCYYIETEPSASGYIYGYWIDQNGTPLRKPGAARVRSSAKTAQTFAPSYDARDLGYITPVEYQTGGSCWAHAATAVMEANAIKKGYATLGEIDLDEYYFIWFGRKGYDANATGSRYDGLVTSDDLLNDGGNALYIANATETFSGPVLESRFSVRTKAPDEKNLAPEDEATLLSSMAAVYTTDARFQYDYVNTKIVDLDATVSDLKQAVLDYGAVQVSYYTPEDSSADQYYTKQWNLGDGEICAYYYPGQKLPTHAVTIVGWDDSFSYENFNEDNQPPADGAWLVKNSWGPDWGNDGYFWLSYCDQTILAAVAYEVEPAREFETVYSYNGVPAINSPVRPTGRYQSAQAFGAIYNVDAAGGQTQYLRKVALGYAGTGASYPYALKVYTGLSSNTSNPTSGTLIYTQQGTARSDAPFIDVTGEVPLTAGQRYSVVVDRNDGYQTSFPVYYEGRNDSEGVYYKSASYETSYKSSGSWWDSKSSNLNNLYIQAFTSAPHADAPQVTFVCPGGYRSTAAATGGSVALPETAGYTWTFTYGGEAFDGANVTHDMTVLAHCVPTEGTVKPGESCTREFKCIYCGQTVFPEQSGHAFTETVINASPTTTGYTKRVCDVCGLKQFDGVNYYPDAVGGSMGNVYWQYYDGVLSFAGEGMIPYYSATDRKPWNSYLGSITRIVINDGITGVGDYAFAYLPAMTEFEFADSVETLGSNVFYDCSALTAATLPGGVRSYGDSIFDNCKNLETLTIGEGVTALNRALISIPDGTYHLRTLSLPSTLTTLGSAVYENGLLTLEEVTVADGNPNYSAVDGVLFNQDQSELILYPPARAALCYCVPAGVTEIEPYAFAHCSAIRYLDLSDCGAAQLPQNALCFVSGLRGLNLPAALTAIESQAIHFDAGSELTSLFVPSTVTQLGEAAIYGTVPTFYTDSADAAINAYAATYGVPCTVGDGHAHAFTTVAESESSTCITQGLQVLTCDCGNFSFEQLPLSTTHQKTNGVVTDPTCQAGGYTTYTCDLCGLVFEDDPTPPSDHVFEWVVDEEATCGKAGVKHEECSGCGATRSENTPIDATGEHTFEWVIDQDETCGEAGVKHEECSGCGATRNENTPIPATGAHTFEWVIDQDETCGEAGVKHEKCSGCGAVRNENTPIPATGAHTYEWVTDTAATCGEAGVKHEKCSGCGALRNENTPIPATGAHTFTKQAASSATQKSAADCEHAATYYYTCADCGAVERNDSHTFQSGAALGHTAPNSEGRCTRCNKQIAEPERDPNACPYCGEVHGGLFGWLVRIIHNILFRIRGAK